MDKYQNEWEQEREYRSFSKFCLILLLIWIVAAFLVAAKLSMTNSDAAQVFAEVGVSDYERPSGSLWQQDFAGYATKWDTRPGMFRVGVDHDGWRISYADLGIYGISAEASDAEDAVVSCNCKVEESDTDMYYTTGSMRALLLTIRGTWKGAFLEAGPGYFRQSFKLEKDDGYRFEQRLWGYGSMVGVGYELKNVSLGLYMYRTNIGAKFENGSTPAGTGGANVLALGYKF